VFDELWSRYPTTHLTACGRAVGLPEVQMGNSEFGHLNLGAGAIVMQDLTRIDAAADKGDLASNEVLRRAFCDAERVHLIGLVSDGGVHSGRSHLEALIGMGAELGVPDLVLHAFTDGRDTLPTPDASSTSPSREVPHVTYFFNGGDEEPCTGERRELVPSPRDVPTYDHKPEMSAPEAAAAFVDAWRENDFRLGIINFANADMVGHTGVIPAAVKAIETVDRCLADVVAAVHESGGACVVTADHGNADHMLEADGSPNTAHSLNPVPLIVTVPGLTLREGGILADVAPTVLQVFGIDQPEAMTGESLIEK
jgi:bisphosphoglycerate-independent phosphoglycerate mutase (AlkP superfamily)